jgi:hypothetical protein
MRPGAFLLSSTIQALFIQGESVLTAIDIVPLWSIGRGSTIAWTHQGSVPLASK